MSITLETVQLIVIVLSFAGGFITFGWAFARWLIARIDAEDQRLNKRIDDMGNRVVMQDTYERDVNRLHEELADVKNDMHSVREQITAQGHQTTQRLDTIIFSLSGNKRPQ